MLCFRIIECAMLWKQFDPLTSSMAGSLRLRFNDRDKDEILFALAFLENAPASIPK